MQWLSGLALLSTLAVSAPTAPFLQVGFGKSDITGPIGEIDLMGYAKLGQAANGVHLRLKARAMVVGTKDARIVYVSSDTGQVSHFVKDRVIAGLNHTLFSEENVMISATHTHSGPAGYLDDFLYVANTFGIVQEERQALADGIITAIKQANYNFEHAPSPLKLSLQEGKVLDASVNRSPTSYLANPAEERAKYPDGDTDKTMTILSATDASGNLASFFSWFAVHGVSMPEDMQYVSGDNKGYASHAWEVGKDADFVAAFSQSNAGDVTPNTAGPKCLDTGAFCDGSETSCPDASGKFRISQCVAKGPGADGFASTKIIGQKQADGAKAILSSSKIDISDASVQFRHVWVDMVNISVKEANGVVGNTCKPAMGQSFSAGTTDGPGVDGSYQGVGPGNGGLGFLASVLQYILAPGQNLPAASHEIQACQAPKTVLLATGEYTVPYKWQPTVLPLQLFIIGRKLVIIGQPSEITTMAGRRLREAVFGQLQSQGSIDADAKIVIAGLSNTYSSYVTTYEEYQKQRYEAGSTIFGQHTLKAYIDKFTALAQSFANPQVTIAQGKPDREGDYSELALNNALIHRVITDGGSYGKIVTDVAKTAKKGDVVSATFECAHPRNHGYFNPYMAVERQSASGTWEQIMTDGAWDTKFMWRRVGGAISANSQCDVSWSIGETVPVTSGTYRLRVFGTSQNLFGFKKEFNGASSPVTVVV
ncbi:hypothetical protein HDU91_006903 [Kappamyces sp. JEL0680]|nr:hypothetical protein HDU91_006903 [Kappamyces sp. JEL0680]